MCLGIYCQFKPGLRRLAGPKMRKKYTNKICNELKDPKITGTRLCVSKLNLLL